jgi:hypothetical protein
VAAHQRALGTLYNGVLNQASLLSYIDIFVLFSLMCLACLIAALCLKTTASRGPVAAH